jgi:ElaB/YqjD/DUF883 family membrane-anchored ribosome-binding protein
MPKKDEHLINIGIFKSKIDELKNKVAELEENFEEKVGEHPIKSLAIALGVGALIGALTAALIKRR